MPGRPRARRRPARLGELLPLRRVDGDVLVLRGGRHRAVLEAGAVPLALRLEHEQEAVLAAYRRFLVALDYPLQLLVRVVPCDVERYLAGLDGAASGEGPLAEVARDHAAFCRRLAREHRPLERRRYVVVPAEEAGAAGSLLRPRGRPGGPVPEEARLTLERRSAEVTEGLRACGVSSRRLGGEEIAALWREMLQGGRSTAGAPGEGAGEGPAEDPDGILPGRLEERRDLLSLDGEMARVLALTGYPRHVEAGWLAPLLDGPEPLDLSLHIEPVDSRDAVRSLTRRLAELESSRLLDARGGRIPSARRSVARADAERLRAELARGDERLLRAACYLRLRGTGPEQLERSEASVAAAVSSLLAEARPQLYEMLPGLLSCLPAAEDHLGRRRLLDGASLATMIPFASGELPRSPAGLLSGRSLEDGSLVVLDPFDPRRENANRVVVATSGAGKSYACKVEALRALLLGIEYYVVDPEGEYGALCSAVGGERLRLSGERPHRINPFDLPRGRGADREGALSRRVLALLGLLRLMLAEPGARLGQAEQGVLDQALYECYRRRGITDDPATHGRPAPLLRDLLAVLEESGEPHGLARRLRRYASGSLGRLFSEPTSAAPASPFVVFDVEGLEEELRPLATYLIADRIRGEVRAEARPRLLLVDEAWSLMRHAEGARLLAAIARQARKRWLGLVTVTQEVSDFLGAPEGRTVLAQSATRLLLRQESSGAALLQESLGLSPGERSFLLACRKGEGLLLAAGRRVPLRIEASPYEHALATTGPEFFLSQQAEAANSRGERR